MLCDICHNREAVLFITQTVNGKKKEIHVCPQCAAEHGLNGDGQKLAQSLVTLMQDLGKPQKVCYACGCKLEDIINRGIVGCPECYAAFSSEIAELFEKNGRELPYTGSMPQKLGHFRSIVTDRIAIENKLKFSIENEEYEKAAMYRDFLNALERGSIDDATKDEGELYE